MPNTFSWGGQEWGFGDLPAFQRYLAQHGTTYSKWAANHPDAAQIIENPPAPINWSAGTNEPSSAPIAGPPGTTIDYSGDPYAGVPTVTDTVGTPQPPDAVPVSPTDTPPPATSVTGVTPPPAVIDWSTIGLYGIDAGTAAKLQAAYVAAVNSGMSVSDALNNALQVARTTDWYAQTYPGIGAGIAAGLFNSEPGYMAYKQQLNQVFQQYYQRPATSSELAGYIQSGSTVDYAAKTFQGQAIAGNLSDPLKALFNPDELAAFGNEQAGIDSPLGQKITAQANLATQLAPLYQNFYGRAPTRAELDTLVQNGTDAATVAQQFATQENVNAMDPAIKDLFTPAEIQEMALDAAGGTTQNGAGLRNLATLATSLNQVYHQYTGAGVSRQEVESAFQTGTTADTVGKQFAGNAWAAANAPDIQQASGSFGSGELSQTDLNTLGQEQAGLDTPQGQMLAAAYSKAQQRLQGVFKGVLAHPALNALGASKPPDVGA